MSARTDPRGPVVVVEQWGHMMGPELWFPYAGAGAPGVRRERGLRSAVEHLARVASGGYAANVARSVWIQERGQWVQA